MIVDNGSSSDAVARLARVDGARLVIAGENRGFAAGVNRCFREANIASDVVVVLNPDTEICEPQTLDTLASEARRPNTALAAPLLLGSSGDEQSTFYRRFPSVKQVLLLTSAPMSIAVARSAEIIGRHPLELSSQELLSGETPVHVMGAVMAIPRAAWGVVGPFDDTYFLYLEETEWQERAILRGFKVRPALGARVMHLHSGGDLAAGVPSPFYVASLSRYLVDRGASGRTVRALMLCGLASSVFFFGLLRVTSIAWVSRRDFSAKSLRASVRAFRAASRT